MGRTALKSYLCGRTYIGAAANRSSGALQTYYRCNGAHTPSLYRNADGRCQSKSIRGEELERQVWADVESFLRNPTPVLERLHAKLKTDVVASDDLIQQVKRLEGLLAQKATERNRVVGLFRRGRLTDAELDTQMDEIAKDAEALQVQVDEIRLKMLGCQSIGNSIDTTQTLLSRLRKRLDEPVCWELKRRLIEILVSRVEVRTFERDGVKQCEITVTYRFSEPTEPLPLTFSQNYNTGQIIRIPIQLNTIGDHIRKKRLGLKIVQKQAAQEIGVCETALFNWEANTSIPEFRYMPAIIRFLGYNPLPRPSAPGEQLVWRRTSLGMSQRALAARLEVDSSTLARWERGDRKPAGNHLTRVERFLTDELQCVKQIDIRVASCT